MERKKIISKILGGVVAAGIMGSTIFPTASVEARPEPPTPVDCNSQNHEFGGGVNYHKDDNGQIDGIVATGANGSRYTLDGDGSNSVYFLDGSVKLLTIGRKSNTPSGFAFIGLNGTVIENGTIGRPISGPVCPRPGKGATKGFSQR